MYIKTRMTTKNPLQSRPIGVFDSGVGGLTLVKSLIRRLPHENIIYFGDTARVPYGSKSPEVVREYTAQDTDFLVSKGVKMIAVACNTVSSVALDVVQKRARVPVIGVIVPGAEAAVGQTVNRRIGVIGTAATVKSNAYRDAVRQLDPLAEVFAQACPLFVPLVEEGLLQHRATEIIAREYLFPLRQHHIDTMILGCTHYPLLSDTIASVLGAGVRLIDSGEAAAGSVESALDQLQLRNPSTLQSNLQFFVSDSPEKFSRIGELFLGRTLGKVRRVSIG